MTMAPAIKHRPAQTETHPSFMVAEAATTGWKATIVIVNYNGGQQIVDCLSSLYQDAAAANYEVIVVDNASSDGSPAEIARRFPEVQLLMSEENQGFGYANNLGVLRAKGDFLAFLNPDTIVEPGWLEALLSAMQTDPEVGLATSKILLMQDPDRINTAGNEVHLTGLTLCRGMNQLATEMSESAEVDAVSGAAFVIRRELFTTLNGFDADFFMYFEDTDLSLRSRLAGYRCLYVPESVVYHDYELHFGPLKTYYEERNRYLTLLKIYRWRTLLLLLPTLLLAEVVTWGYVLLHDRPRWRNKLRAYGDIISEWWAISQERQQVQSIRQVHDRVLLRSTSYRIVFEQTGDGFVARIAHLIFDPLFYLGHRLVLALL